MISCMMNGPSSNSSESDDESYSFVDDESSSGGDDSFSIFDEDEDDFSTNTNTNGDNDGCGNSNGGHQGNRTRHRYMRAVLRQHLPAIIIAAVAAVVGHAHLNNGEFLHVTLTGLYRDFVEHRANANGGTIGTSGKFAAEPTLNVPSPYPTASTPHISPTSNAGSTNHPQYHHEYRRTANLGFCQDHDEVNNNNNYLEGVRKLLMVDDENGDSNMRNVNSNPGLVSFDFRVPSDLVSTMGVHYLADGRKEDMYDSVLAAGEPGTASVADREFQCLRDKAAEASNARHNLKGWGLAYVQPDVSTFYRETGTSSDDSAAGNDPGIRPEDAVSGQSPGMPSVKSILKSRRDEHLQKNPEAAAEAAKREEQAAAAAAGGDSDIGNKIAAVTPKFSGFAAKFTNLSPESLNLFWDGRGGSNPRLVGRVPPFESLGTATTPGQSFSIIPAAQGKYNDRFVLQRWTMTADEAHVYYDPSDLDNLTPEQQARYKMWKLNQAYARDYLIKTKRTWLADFPRPVPFHYMHTAEYFGKTKSVKTFERHFITRPPRNELEKLSYHDHERRVHREARYGKDLSISLPKYRQEGVRELELKMETISCAPQVFRIDNFLSAVEAGHIIDLKDGSRNITLSRSTVHPGGVSSYGDDAEKSENEQVDAATRSSTNAWIEREASPIVDSIYRRAADLLGIDESLLRHRSNEEHPELATDHSIAERMQLVHYGEGEEYHAHHDFSYPAFGNRHQPGRFATLLLYLNDVEDGGETVFPRAVNSESHDGISIGKPKAGTAILFYNTLPDGNFDDLSQHQSTPVQSGEKYLANLWIWDPVID